MEHTQGTCHQGTRTERDHQRKLDQHHFLVKTDTHAINSELDYQIQGYKTVIQTKKNTALPTRIICLIDEEMSHQIIIRTDLTSADFPSLWVEIENDHGKNVLSGGFYREWTPNGENSIEAQVKAMQSFTKQIENTSAECKKRHDTW